MSATTAALTVAATASVAASSAFGAFPAKLRQNASLMKLFLCRHFVAVGLGNRPVVIHTPLEGLVVCVRLFARCLIMRSVAHAIFLHRTLCHRSTSIVDELHPEAVPRGSKEAWLQRPLLCGLRRRRHRRICSADLCREAKLHCLLPLSRFFVTKLPLQSFQLSLYQVESFRALVPLRVPSEDLANATHQVLKLCCHCWICALPQHAFEVCQHVLGALTNRIQEREVLVVLAHILPVLSHVVSGCAHETRLRHSLRLFESTFRRRD